MAQLLARATRRRVERKYNSVGRKGGKSSRDDSGRKERDVSNRKRKYQSAGPRRQIYEHGNSYYHNGKLAIISTPKHTIISFNVKLLEGDPFFRNARDSDDETLMAGIGVDFSTRRWNKLAWKITKREGQDDGYQCQ
ncbi:hypothetical protein DFS33DRAFT_1455970 [Desarmillaria ectypa]|nr:hypothetical protein DFS33DRAFT_1455970 [Desarmillaria ectypa]